MKNYLLDTNLIVAIIRSQTFAVNLEKSHSFSTNSLISVVVQGELQSLAIQWDWGYAKIQKLQVLLQALLIYPLKVQTVIDAYARIDAFSQGKLPDEPLPAGLSSRNMGKNDLWIAATAHATEATLLTTDMDFDHLDGVFFDLERIDIKLYL